ncbi:MAG TPA: redoxin domain-containing protein [Pyrinomonadaceae bacterium]|nr:redoxin domain-containing protein [Pyrinomonadaceae bacterium]
MKFARSFRVITASLGIILLSNFAALSQYRNKKRSAAKQAPIVVKEINTESMTSLLKREPSAPRPLLVNFWATWCDPCREEFPDLVKIDKDYRPKGLDFIAISLDDLSDIKTEVPKFLRQMRATMPAYLLNVPDPEKAINAIDPRWSGALPATFLYDAQGQVVFKHFGRVQPEELRSAIEKLVGTQAVTSNK